MSNQQDNLTRKSHLTPKGTPPGQVRLSTKRKRPEYGLELMAKAAARRARPRNPRPAKELERMKAEAAAAIDKQETAREKRKADLASHNEQ